MILLFGIGSISYRVGNCNGGLELSIKLRNEAGDEVTAAVEKAPGVKCPRCWNYSEKADAEGLCPRCQAVMFKRVETTR